MRLIRARSHVKLTSVPAEGVCGRGVRNKPPPPTLRGGVGGGEEAGGFNMAAAGFMARKNGSLGECKQLNIILSPAPAEATFKCSSVQSSYVITHTKKRTRQLWQHGDRRGGGARGCVWGRCGVY